MSRLTIEMSVGLRRRSESHDRPQRLGIGENLQGSHVVDGTSLHGRSRGLGIGPKRRRAPQYLMNDHETRFVFVTRRVRLITVGIEGNAIAFVRQAS